MATGYTRIGKLMIPYEKPDPKPSLLQQAVEVVKPKRRGRRKKTEEVVEQQPPSEETES